MHRRETSIARITRGGTERKRENEEREKERGGGEAAFSIRLHLLHVFFLIRGEVGEDVLDGIARAGRFIPLCIVFLRARGPPRKGREAERIERNERGNCGGEDRHPSPG